VCRGLLNRQGVTCKAENHTSYQQRALHGPNTVSKIFSGLNSAR
jgi:hypothetical protein